MASTDTDVAEEKKVEEAPEVEGAETPAEEAAEEETPAEEAKEEAKAE